MEITSLITSFIGIVSWCYIWVSSKYQTSRDVATQIGLILIGCGWLSLFVASTAAHEAALTSTIAFRFLMLFGFLLLMPLLRR